MTSTRIFNASDVPEVVDGNLFVTGNEIVGGNLTVQGELVANSTFNPTSINTGTVTTGTLTTSVLTASSFIQPYAPISTTATLDFYGDSWTFGVGATTTAMRWSSLVSAALGKTENNQGSDGAQLMDVVKLIYQTRGIGGTNTLFLMAGVNDMKFTVNVEGLKRPMIAAILFSILPAANILNPRSSAVTKTGTWGNSNLYNNIGITTAVVGGAGGSYDASLTATVTGRFVCFAVSAVNDTTAGGGVLPNVTAWTVTIDGVSYTQGQNIGAYNFNMNIPSGVNWASYPFIFDTGSSSSTSHVIVITPILFGATYTENAFVDWIGGFSPNQAGAITCIVVPQDEYDYNQNGGCQSVLDGYVKMERDVTRWFQTYLQLPVYFVTDACPVNWLGFTFDLLHPNNGGHNYIANRVLSVISQGETNYLSS